MPGNNHFPKHLHAACKHQPPSSLSASDLTLSHRESFSQGLPLWCSGEGVSFTPDLDSLSGSSDDPNPAARLFAATAALACLPLADVELWTDGSVAPGVGAGFVIYVNCLLYASEAHLACLEASDFHAEAVAMSLGLTALTALNLSHSHSSIRILTDCQSLIITLSRGPPRQPDSACTSIWSYLSSISKTSSIHIQWIPAHIGIPGNSLADLDAKTGSTLPPTSVPVDLATAKALIWKTGQKEFHTRYT